MRPSPIRDFTDNVANLVTLLVLLKKIITKSAASNRMIDPSFYCSADRHTTDRHTQTERDTDKQTPTDI